MLDIRISRCVILATIFIACTSNEEKNNQLDKVLFMNRAICDYISHTGTISDNIEELNRFIKSNFDSNKSFQYSEEFELKYFPQFQKILVTHKEDTLIFKDLNQCFKADDLVDNCSSKLFLFNDDLLETDKIDSISQFVMNTVDSNHLNLEQFFIRSNAHVLFELKHNKYQILIYNDTITPPQVLEDVLNEAELLKQNKVHRGIICYWYNLPPD